MRRFLRRTAEIIILTLGTWYLFSLVGFIHGQVIPESAWILVLPSLVLAVFYGGWWSLVAYLLPVAGVWSWAILKGWWFEPLQGWLEAGGGVVLFVLTGRLFLRQAQENARRRFRELMGRLHRVKRENRALRSASLVLESRLAQQRRFAPFLLERLNKLDQLDLKGALSEVLELAHTFVGVEKASIWTLATDRNSLTLVTSLGWVASDEFPTEKALDSSIEGWVLRNAEPFSIRMAAGFDHYRKMKPERNILTQPIHKSDRIWGVLNVEALPFALYSPYAESVLEVILKLAEKFLAPIIDHEELFLGQEVDSLTGLSSIAVFYKTLEAKWERLQLDQGRVSVVILEFAELDRQVERVAYARFIKEFLLTFRKRFPFAGEVFHYKEFNQLVFVLTGLDHDGTSLFCLKVLGFYNEDFFQAASLNGGELLIGYAGGRAGDGRWEALDEQAERLLAMQKV